MQLVSTCLTSNAYFTVYKWKFSGLVDFKQSAPYLLCSVLSGNGTLTVDSRIYCLKKGDHFLLPNNVTDWEIDGQLEMIVSHPNEAWVWVMNKHYQLFLSVLKLGDPIILRELIIVWKTMETTFMVCNGQFLICVVKRQPLLVSNFNGKMVSWNTNFTWILRPALWLWRIIVVVIELSLNRPLKISYMTLRIS